MPYFNSIGPALLKSDDVIDPESMLVQLSQTTLQSFVDYQSGVAYFDSDAFVELLKASKQTDSANDASSAPEVRLASVGDFMQQQVRESIAGGEIKYIGFPTLDPSASGNYINNQNDYLAMSAVSSQKDACWEYLKLVMSEDFQNQVYIKPIADTFPTNKASMENMIRYSSEPQYDEYGEEIHVRGMYNFDYQPATTAQIDSIMNLIDSLERSQREDLTVYEILSEELQAYYESDLSAEKVAENIQNRVSIYLGEIQN